MQVLPWHIAYLSLVTTGNLALALANAGWSLPAQLAVTAALPAALVASALLLVRRAHR